MSRENGGVVGAKNIITQSYAVGVFNIKTQFVNNQAASWPRSGSIFIALSHAVTPFISIYPFSSLGYGAKLSDPSTLPAGTGQNVSFSPSGKSVAISHATTPFVSAYPWSAAGFHRL